MNYFWLEDLNENISLFMDSLRKEKFFEFFPARNGLTNEGKKINLGFSCYALKIFYITGAWEDINQDRKVNWTDYINSYQKTIENFPANSFIDDEYLNSFLNYSKKETIKNNLKKILNNTSKKNYLINEDKILNFIRAETKQSLASLIEIKASLKNKFLEFPSNEHEINKFIYGLNWNYPWSSGGQLAAISLFSKTQLDDSTFQKNKKIIESFLSKLVNVKDGMYYDSIKQPKNFELVNGAMKVISAMDWLDMEIHYPEKIIDTCLDIDPISEGCDIVDIVYVLHKCSKQTSYKKNEIVNYFSKILDLIYQHYKPELGGFSYFKNRCQTNYYDVQFANESNTADIHGTVLMLWAVIMIMDTTEIEYFNYKIIKP